MDKAIFRIIDANFNRAREGLRVAEDFCRFALNNQLLSGKCKQIRHQLCGAVSKFDSQRLIAARDTQNDVGCDLKVAGQMKRASLEDCVSAGFARTTEALRAIGESAATFDTALAQTFEKLRYDCYVLEKEIMLLGSPAIRFSKVRLYVVLTVESCKDVLSTAKDCAENGADCLQLRVKAMADGKFFALAQKFVDLCKQHNVVSIINDRVDIAVASGADGVHLGQDDLSVEQVHACQLKPLLIGVSTHSFAELQKAIEQQPCYVGLGSVFPTDTKQDVNICGLDYISKATEFLKNSPVQSVAIGGINLENVEKVLRAGVKKIAVSSCVCKADNPADICRKFVKIISAQP
ncbi:MAG: thiamine-phosphate diphosphorylase [Planctomycetes bacterium GWC2_45_44]|nr:MAG: thiamine-phosphate diphosphorylase [Planctomycetes bacterium GWC2_45_44]HBR20852.1 thiamine phosphate synthase [Phycisphaerales bacterium]